MSKIGPVWIHFALADFFLVWWQKRAAFVLLSTGPWLFLSMACDSGDSHQLVTPSTDTDTSSWSQQITF